MLRPQVRLQTRGLLGHENHTLSLELKLAAGYRGFRVLFGCVYNHLVQILHRKVSGKANIAVGRHFYTLLPMEVYLHVLPFTMTIKMNVYSHSRADNFYVILVPIILRNDDDDDDDLCDGQNKEHVDDQTVQTCRIIRIVGCPYVIVPKTAQVIATTCAGDDVVVTVIMVFIGPIVIINKHDH